MIVASARKPLVVDAASVSLLPDGRAIRVRKPETADRLIPLRRIGQVTIRNAQDPWLTACLSLVREGCTVHFQGAHGEVVGVLQPARVTPAHWALELAQRVEHSSGLGRFNWWRDVQLRHAWSLVFRSGFPGDTKANQARLLRYLRYFRPEIAMQSELRRLDGELLAWLQATLNEAGAQPAVRALDARGCDITGVLEECLRLPLWWRYVRWRREQPVQIDAERLTEFFVLQAAAPLRDQLQRHVRALVAEFHAPINTADDDEESGYDDG